MGSSRVTPTVRYVPSNVTATQRLAWKRLVLTGNRIEIQVDWTVE